MQYATRAEAREVAARAVASLGRGKDRAGAGKKMVQAWYRMAAEVNREFSCIGPVWEAAFIQMGIYQEGYMHETASVCISLSTLPHHQTLVNPKIRT